MMRVLFTTLPGAGPFHPLVPLAQTLQTAGHEVAFACAHSYCPTVELPPVFVGPLLRIPQTVQFLRPISFNQSGDEGLPAWVPMVLIPLAGGDQRGNAERCAALGVGRVIVPEQRAPEVIREAVLEVLGNPRYHARAERLREEMQRLSGPDYAVALLEKLAAGNTSQVLLTS